MSLLLAMEDMLVTSSEKMGTIMTRKIDRMKQMFVFGVASICDGSGDDGVIGKKQE